jgi:lycopene cyclase domain-containing protein
MGGPFTYLIMELGWALPAILLQWALGHRTLIARRRLVATAVAIPTVYLTLADSLAIRRGIWTLSTDLTLDVAPAGIPVEEALFFFLTNVMVVQGLLLIHEPGEPLARARRLLARFRKSAPPISLARSARRDDPRRRVGRIRNRAARRRADGAAGAHHRRGVRTLAIPGDAADPGL